MDDCSDKGKPPFVCLDDRITGVQRFYENPVQILTANSGDDVAHVLVQMQESLDAGFYLAGYVAYEAGYALEPSLQKYLQDSYDAPLICMGVFEGYEAGAPPKPESLKGVTASALTPAWTAQQYQARFEAVKSYIRAGDVYQINLSFPMRGQYSRSALELYQALKSRQPVRFGAVISLCGPDIISFSPELFFKTSTGGEIELRPMKGTARRQEAAEDDRLAGLALQADTKNRAENLMIVDLLRNDVSRIAQTGSVSVPKLFSIETYPTLHQMTSTVTAKLKSGVSVADLFTALFPCGSITGAPKIRAMEIIAELEAGPRGAYCGAIGYFDPGGKSCFSVAIRTASLEGGQFTYPVGSGVVMDSVGSEEYDECLLKARLLRPAKPARPELIETFRWDASSGPLRGERHLARLKSAAKALGYPFDEARARKLIGALGGKDDLRARLSLSADGGLALTSAVFTPMIEPVPVSLSAKPLSRAVQETRYKVSARDFYDGERARISALTGAKEVLFFNPDGELCEGSYTSVFISKGGKLFTPPLTCGLLPGVLRADLIEGGGAEEKILKLQDVLEAEEIFIGNSLRGLMKGKLTEPNRL